MWFFVLSPPLLPKLEHFVPHLEMLHVPPVSPELLVLSCPIRFELPTFAAMVTVSYSYVLRINREDPLLQRLETHYRILILSCL